VSWEEVHPAVNAVLNATSSVFLLLGFFAIRRGDRQRHRRLMLSAFTCSAVFLASYLVRYAISGTHHYPGQGWDKALYLAVLMSHMVLAMVALPLILRLLWLARGQRFAKHRRLARYAWPIWMYVSVTGVVVYLMLYPIAGAVYGR